MKVANNKGFGKHDLKGTNPDIFVSYKFLLIKKKENKILPNILTQFEKTNPGVP